MKRKPKREFIAWIVTILVVLGIKIFSLDGYRVESIYSNWIYPKISNLLVWLTRWLPFSIGDILYLAAAVWLLIKLFKNVKGIFKNGFRKRVFFSKTRKLLLISCWIYIIFNILWGLNYNRLGIGYQLQFVTTEYSVEDLVSMNKILLRKANNSRQEVSDMKLDSFSKKLIFEKAESTYKNLQKKYPFLKKNKFSLKVSLYGKAGNYLGFTGYYNPFTGEAQANTTVPVFLQPYIATHELAHELGYAKEDEANFVGYLAASQSDDPFFNYSTYLDLFMYANRELFLNDSISSKSFYDSLSPKVKNDIEVWRRFNLSHQSFIEPVITWLYSKYLKLNQQPKGMRSYNQVTAMLIAYYKKYHTL